MSDLVRLPHVPMRWFLSCTVQARLRRIRGQCLANFFLPPHKLCCAQKNLFKHTVKTRILPLLQCFCSPNFKTWLQAWYRVPALAHHHMRNVLSAA